VKRLIFPFAVMCVAAVAVIAQQQSTPVNNSRSNIKNNLTIAPGPKGTLMCKADGKPCTADQVKELAARYHII
jgi:dTDP-4-amino-4,6-dideoxygalactose transaminase